ncbi:hypothetical protein [Marinobacterium aestuariivivens]|uniref:Uncharacterized protein n=1 Tax=Marinobacterium aestuariivivens TaxID=1698799 RepID=A0ABW2A8Y6_9GAMM
MSEKELYRTARREDAGWYVIALIVIVVGFSITEFLALPRSSRQWC